MKKIIAVVFFLFLMFAVLPANADAAVTYTVKAGDSMWKIAVKYQVGLSELISANPEIKNPDLIYPGQTLTIPYIDRTFEKEVIRLTNAERAKYGLPALAEDWELSRVARFKSEDMRDMNYFSHYSPIYGSPFTMMKNFGIRYVSAGENIAAGYTSPEAVVKGWMESSGHRANILNNGFTHIGVGYAKGGTYGSYWTQMFISR